ncbi:MAG: hypothetical protein IJX05_01300 [Clostridia bacterium]|nr:hypothetical protein [Clostridia bacterium]
MNKNTTRVISLLAVMLALLFVAMTLDRAISVWSPVSFAIVSTATVSTFALLKRKFQVAIAAGFFFGIASLVTAFMFGKTTFYNPLVAILPRAFVGITGYGVYRLVALILRKIKNERIREYIALSFGGAFVALSNTIYTLTCMFLFAQGDPLFVAFVGVFITNVLPELLCSIIVTPLLVLGVRRGLRLNVDGSERLKKVEKTDE